MRFHTTAIICLISAVQNAQHVHGFMVPKSWTIRDRKQMTVIRENPSATTADSPRTMSSTSIATPGTTNENSSMGNDMPYTPGITERIMKRIPLESQASGAGGASTWDAFLRAEANWARLRESTGMPPAPMPPFPFVTEKNDSRGNPRCYAKLEEQRNKELDYDVVVCGGTLGIFFATALQVRGYRVAVLEAAKKLKGRQQEWNISWDELDHLKKLGVVTQDDLEAAVRTEFPGCRSGFKNQEVSNLKGGYHVNGIGYECFTEDVLNLGILPSVLLDRVAKRFVELGGVLKEGTRLNGVAVLSDVGAALDVGSNSGEDEPITAKLVMDAMGNNSPITRQQRHGSQPDGICAVVGSCASGYDPETNLIGDIIYTNNPIQNKGKNGKNQYFWESFPVGTGRNGSTRSSTKTTYMFTYMDANSRRPTMESLMEDYWRLLPEYQPSISNPETDLDVKRVLFAYFPTYRGSPLKPDFDRLLAVGDASGIQSPLSFGGFGALTRHLDRITTAVGEALDYDLLSKQQLGEINAYTPNLSAAWMFQKAMSIRMNQVLAGRKFINRLLATNFEVMDKMGPRTIKPFLQDVVRFDGLVGSLAGSFVADPFFMPEIVAWVGIPTLVEWMGHVGMMGTYAALDNFVTPWLRPIADSTLRSEKLRYMLHRKMDAWRFGSGNDYDISELPRN